jgi:hypothetical protein
MTNLIAELRRPYEALSDKSLRDLCLEAADEIERLRAALRDIANNEYSGYGGIGGIARKALSGICGE